MKETSILVIEDNPRDAEIFKRILEEEGFTVKVASTGEQGLAWAKRGNFALVLTDLNLGGPRPDEGFHLVSELRTANPHLPVILMTGAHTAEIAIDVIKLGAFDYFSKPMDVFGEQFRSELTAMLKKAVDSHRLMVEVKVQDHSNSHAEPTTDLIVGRSRVMQDVYKEIGRVADKPVTVLIRGETGTGKELVARAIYTYSSRANEPFIVVNCAAIPESLLESELFGHEPGAFTGAKNRRLGRFELAHHGTIFLDEIGDMDVKLQQKLLRVLQEGTIERVGGKEPIPVDVRVLAATHRNLETAIQEGTFRRDLYFRLNVALITLPPLRERREDIPELVKYFIQRYGPALGAVQSSWMTKGLEEAVISFYVSRREPLSELATAYVEAMKFLQQQEWPGNVRELRNVVRKALLLARHYPVTIVDIRHALEQMKPSPDDDESFSAYVSRMLGNAYADERDNVLPDLLNTVERELYSQVIERTGGDQSVAAQWLGVSRPTVRDKLSRYLLLPVREMKSPRR